MEYHSLSFEVKDNLAYVGFGHDPSLSMPLLNAQTIQELEQVVDDVVKRQKKEIKGLIFFSHNSRAFLAGADIKLIASMETEAQATQGAERGQKLFNKIEDLSIATLACVHGVCLGGGCELILACDKIYASDDDRTQIGLPEVTLGIIPGFGGTYRMPSRVGLPSALELILTGKKIGTRKARRMGLVDEVYPKERMLEMAAQKYGKGPMEKRIYVWTVPMDEK